MATTTSVSFPFKLSGSFWNPGESINWPWNPDVDLGLDPDPKQFDEKGFWLQAGNSDGQQGVQSKVLLVPSQFQFDYANGYSDGAWKRLVFIQG